jgi:small nuclear ribonucleoprotein (snRNP)-like protein
LIGAVIAGCLVEQTRFSESPALHAGTNGTLHSVLLTNGQVYYGTLDRIDAHDVVLTHVFYVQVTTDTKTNERTNKLVDRMANDWYGPLSMTIPIDKIVFIEVVGPNSTVAKLIGEETGKGK